MRVLLLACVLFAAACGSQAAAPSSTSPTAAAPVATPEAAPSPEAAAPPPAGAGELACNAGTFGPAALSEAQKGQRYGANARTFADAPSSKERPIEVCGVRASKQWLRGTACADGSPPTQDGRRGNVGGGGRCGSVIDLYSVTCPEGSYEVFIDIYMCGPGESMF